MMVDQHNHSSSRTRGSGTGRRSRKIDHGELHLPPPSCAAFAVNSEILTCEGGGGGRGEWGGNGPQNPMVLLSSVGNALKCAVNSIRADVAVQTTNARDQLLRSCRGRQETGARGGSYRRCRVVAAISLSQNAGSDQVS